MGWFRVLAIGGSDSGGGAGIEADVKTITALGGYAMTAITAVTAQDTSGIAAITPVPPDLVACAIRMVIADLGVDAIKLGMLGSAATVEAVAAALAPGAKLVIDPVLASTSGTALAGAGALAALRDLLLPRATLLTPNRDEAAALTGRAVETPEDALRAGAALLGMGARAVLLKGGHFAGDTLVDRLFTAEGMIAFTHERIATRHTHGTGCTLASAIACGLAGGLDLAAAVGAAEAFLAAALRAAPAYGRGHGPLGHARAAMPLQDRPPA